MLQHPHMQQMHRMPSDHSAPSNGYQRVSDQAWRDIFTGADIAADTDCSMVLHGHAADDLANMHAEILTLSIDAGGARRGAYT